MSTQSISIRYRPIKIGFLIEDGNLSSLVKAAEINSVLWGGIYNVIIPVGEDVLKVERLINLFNVDVLIPLDSSDLIKKIMDEDKFRTLPLSRQLFYEDWQSKKREISVLDIVNLFDLLWEKEFKNFPKIFKSRFNIFEWEDVSFENVGVINYGRFPTDLNLKFDYQDIFLKALKAGKITIGKDKFPDKNHARYVSPILTTSLELSGYFGSGLSFGAYFGDHNSFADLCHFWNLRACGMRLEFIPESKISEHGEYLIGFLEELDKLPNSHPDIPDSVALYIKDDVVQARINEVLKGYTSSKRLIFVSLTSGGLYKPSIFYFDWKTAISTLDKPYGKLQLSISLPEKKFLIETEDKRNQRIAINVQPIGEFGYEEHTLKLPYLKGFNEFYSREVAFVPWSARVGKDGITLIQEVGSELLNLSPISFRSIIQEIFKSCGFDRAFQSLPGKVTENILKQMGGLEDCRVFKMDCVRRLLANPDPIDRKVLNQTLQINSTKYQDLILVQNQPQPIPTRKNTIDHLLDKKLISIGYNLRCCNCELHSWFSLKTVDEQWTCQYCDAENSSSKQIFEANGNSFQTSGLFKLEKKRQEGAIPVVLTLLLLQRIVRDFGFIYTTALKLELQKGQPGCEIDLCVLEQIPSDSSVSIGIGECKDGNEIDDKDIANLKLVRERLLKKGLRCFLIFSKLSKFTDTELARFKSLHAEKIPIILLTNSELDEPMYPYWKDQDPKLPQRLANSLDDLYRNSVYLYLS